MGKTVKQIIKNVKHFYRCFVFNTCLGKFFSGYATGDEVIKQVNKTTLRARFDSSSQCAEYLTTEQNVFSNRSNLSQYSPYHCSRNASVIRCLPVPVPAK